MTPESLTGVVHRLRVAVDPATPQRADADLVRAVARHRDPAAFADIVRRHGPMVLGTCRRVLRDHTDADDAFQATFLVFLRRAGGLRNPERLAGWLFQAAYRTSQRVRAVRLARRSREVALFDLPGGEPPAEFIWRELRPIFDAELARLPDKLRLPAVLCLLEGRSKRDAAKTLGWPEGTIAGRLQQARETLRRRFAARGLTLSAGALAVALFEGAGAVAVPPALFASTIHGLAAGSASAGTAALADGVVYAMFVTKVKALTAAVLLTGLVGTGTGVVLTPGSGPGVAVAQAPPTGDPAKVNVNDERQMRMLLEHQREKAVRADLNARHLKDSATKETATFRSYLLLHQAVLEQQVEAGSAALKAGTLPKAEVDLLDKRKTELAAIQKELKEAAPPPNPDPPAKELERLRKEHEELKRELDRQREAAVLADLNAKTFQQKYRDLQRELEAQSKFLSTPLTAIPAPAGARGKVVEVNQGSGLAQINIGSDVGVSRGHVLTVFVGSEYKGELTVTAVDPKSAVGKFTPVRRGVEIKKDDSVVTSVEPDRAAQRARLEADVAQWRDRKNYAEQMVKKGFMTQAQLAADAARLAEAEAALAKFDAARPPVEKTADDLAARLREIDREKQAREVERLREDLKRMEELFRKGLVAQAEMDAAKVQLAQAEIDLRKLTLPPGADPRRAKLEESVKRLTERFEKAEAGHKQKVVPELEYLQAKLRKLQAEFDVLTLAPPDNHRELVRRQDALTAIAQVMDEIDQKLSQGYKAGAVAAVEVHRARVVAAAKKAELNDRLGQYDRAVGHWEGAVRELDALLDLAKAGAANDQFSASDLRQFRLDMAEAKAGLHRSQLRKQLTEIVTIRADDLEFRKKLFTAGAVAKAEVAAAEAALADAKAKLADGK